jgi:hypothetical protein
MNFKVGNLVQYTDLEGTDTGIVTYVDAERMKIKWIPYDDNREYNYLLKADCVKRFNVVA